MRLLENFRLFVPHLAFRSEYWLRIHYHTHLPYDIAKYSLNCCTVAGLRDGVPSALIIKGS